MPIPGTPTSVTSWVERSRRDRRSASTSRSSSSSRPTSVALPVPPRSTPSRARGSSASQTGTGCAFPLASTGGVSRYTISRSVARYVCFPTRIPSTGAADCRRAAVFITSPATIPSPSPGFASSETSASPVLTAIRTWRSRSGSISLSCATASRTASAARTARSGSSSCDTGAPNTATTASPMNFSTVPPNRSSSSRARSWYVRSSARTSSGSLSSARAVEPTRSVKTTLTTLRSSRRAVVGVAASDVPHAEQNFAASAFSAPQVGHAAMRASVCRASARVGVRGGSTSACAGTART